MHKVALIGLQAGYWVNAAPAQVVHRHRSQSALATTLTELNAIAAAAHIGCKTPKAASGIKTVL